jgi:hypothetical protein
MGVEPSCVCIVFARIIRSMADTGICEHCDQQFAYDLLHNGFNDTAYAYCDTSGCTALLSAWSKIPLGAPIRFHTCINKAVEPYLKSCSCGGHFRADPGHTITSVVFTLNRAE